MIHRIERHREALNHLCRKHSVQRLELFGSAADGSWQSETSDIDFLIEFLPLKPGQLFDFFFDIKEDLQALLGRKVDLVMPRAIRNPDFLDSVNRSRQVLYAA